MLKNLTVGRKIGLGFGVVVVALACVGGWSIVGFNGTVSGLATTVNCNALQNQVVESEVAHLQWANAVNALLTDENVTELTVQTDPHKCAFGQWYYGEGRTHAEQLVPEIKDHLTAIEDPHRRLHESAIEIGKVFRQPHRGLSNTLTARLNDHVMWVGHVTDALSREANLYAYQNRVCPVVQEAISLIKACDEDETLGDVPARQARAAQLIKTLRYGPEDKDYLWINDTYPRMVMHPYKPELDGKDLTDDADPNGKHLFVEMAKVCKANGQGYVAYHWPHPATGQLTPKISYVQLYEPWNWVVGTGVFVENETPAFIARLNDFVDGRPFSLGVQTDPTQCAFGKWLGDPATTKLCAGFPELKAALDACREPHARLHQYGVQIESLITNRDMGEAFGIYQREVGPVLAEIRKHFEAGLAAELALEDAANQAALLYVTKAKPALEEVQTLLGEIEQKTRAASQAQNAAIQAQANHTRLGVVLVSAIGGLVAIVLAFAIVRGIGKVLTRIIAGLGDGADQVNDAAAQVSSASQNLAEGTSEQASSLEETSSALEQMAAMSRTNTENARQANDLSEQARNAAQSGDKTMEKLNAAMTAINESSGQISKIIKVIEEIAFQTNLLALNAAVEAARAGEHGKGFAVVADEVRNLAQRAAQAARETTGLIEQSVANAQEGTKVAGEVGTALGAIVSDVGKVADLVNGITRASEEQTQGVDQINTAVSQMDKVTQQNASGAEESASAAEELAAQAANVKGMVNELVTMVRGQAREDTSGSPKPAKPTAYTKSVMPSVKPKVTVLQHEPVRAGAGSPAGPGKSAREFMSLDDNDGLKEF